MIGLNGMMESNTIIGPNAIIWPDEIIINWTQCVIEPYVTFESNTIIGPNVVIGKNHTIIGYNTRAAIDTDSSMA